MTNEARRELYLTEHIKFHENRAYNRSGSFSDREAAKLEIIRLQKELKEFYEEFPEYLV